MLVNDSVTVAVEIPVFLTREDIAYYRQNRFDIDFETSVITGHIDFLQIRNGNIHVLDYKPDARKEKHAHVQLTENYATRMASLALPTSPNNKKRHETLCALAKWRRARAIAGEMRSSGDGAQLAGLEDCANG